MNDVKYFIVESTVTVNGIPQITYGIATLDVSSPEAFDACIYDITTDRKSIEQLVALCNREKLSPIHLYDVIEDFLCY